MHGVSAHTCMTHGVPRHWYRWTPPAGDCSSQGSRRLIGQPSAAKPSWLAASREACSLRQLAGRLLAGSPPGRQPTFCQTAKPDCPLVISHTLFLFFLLTFVPPRKQSRPARILLLLLLLLYLLLAEPTLRVPDAHHPPQCGHRHRCSASAPPGLRSASRHSFTPSPRHGAACGAPGAFRAASVGVDPGHLGARSARLLPGPRCLCFLGRTCCLSCSINSLPTRNLVGLTLCAALRPPSPRRPQAPPGPPVGEDIHHVEPLWHAHGASTAAMLARPLARRAPHR